MDSLRPPLLRAAELDSKSSHAGSSPMPTALQMRSYASIELRHLISALAGRTSPYYSIPPLDERNQRPK